MESYYSRTPLLYCNNNNEKEKAMALRNYEGSITKRVHMRVRLTAKDWQLYTASMDCEDAADALNDAATKALSCGDPKEAVKIFSEARNKWAEFGAYDSEPGHEWADLFTEAFGEEAYVKYC